MTPNSFHTRSCRGSQLTFLAVLTAGIALACQDTIVRSLGPENNVQEYVQPDSFRFQASELSNVTDEVSYTWMNTGTSAVVMHRSFVHHGHGDILILDAQGNVIYDVGTLENNLDNETDEGMSGNWTIRLRLFGAKGRVDFSVVSKR